jgi:hypothetical protein
MSVYASDIIGSPSGTTITSHSRNIIVGTPKAANPMSLIRRDIEIIGSPSGIVNSMTDRFMLRPQPVFLINQFPSGVPTFFG